MTKWYLTFLPTRAIPDTYRQNYEYQYLNDLFHCLCTCPQMLSAKILNFCFHIPNLKSKIFLIFRYQYSKIYFQVK
ncbi:unnamed protein product [Meloidogyne enterolobii]|uniref:Uncharacterized protein n=1 Tax=Meloidogyne enterolobii TaxID=390850 RepID=A0ACB0YN95_MELEN